MTNRDRVRKFRANRLKAGLCINCGKKKGKKFSHRCPACQAKCRRYLQVWREAKRLGGVIFRDAKGRYKVSVKEKPSGKTSAKTK